MSKKKKKLVFIPVQLGDWKFSLPSRLWALAILLPVFRVLPMILLAGAGFWIFRDWRGAFAGAMPSVISELIKTVFRSRSG